MKNYSTYFPALAVWVLFACCFTLASCDEEEESVQKKTLTLLSAGNWHIANLTVDGINKSNLATGFTLTISSGVYSAVNGGPVWPVSGTWTFIDADARTIIRDDGVEITITSLTEKNLTLSLQWNKTILGGGRINSISGQHVFELSR